LRAKAANPDLQVTIHDERPALLTLSRRIAALNFPDPTGIAWSNVTLNPEGIWSGLHRLLAETRPEVLRLSGPLLPAEAFGEAALTGVRRILVPFLDPSEVTAARTKLAPALGTVGFAEDMNGEPNGTICFRRD
ncbi:hypothetical protein I8752_22150, partial [Nostocaceae cyanobacterium CENA369]